MKNQFKIKDVLYLPSGRIFLLDCEGYTIECTEMRDVSVEGKQHEEVRKTNDPKIIWKHLVPYEKKWLLNVSTQKGCPYNCKFCDVAQLPFKGNLDWIQILGQVDILVRNTLYVKKSKKAKIGFARMGEPATNLENVLKAMRHLNQISSAHNCNLSWLPCFNSILPESVPDTIDEVMELKEKDYNGFLHFQISCNSTDEKWRKKLFDDVDVIPIEQIVKRINKIQVTKRTITLNFIVMKDVPVSVKVLKTMGLSSDKFTVKLIPLNKTLNAETHKLETYANYNNYQKLVELKNEFEKEGIPVVVDAIAKCEEAGLCCGQLAQIYQ